MSSDMVDRWNEVLNKTYRETRIGDVRRAIRLRVVDKPFRTLAIDIYEDGEFLDRVIIGHFDAWINIAKSVWSEMITSGYLFDRSSDNERDDEESRNSSRRRGGRRGGRRTGNRRPERE